MKLLVVDDDADMLAVVSFALRQAGFPVVTANSYGTGWQPFAASGRIWPFSISICRAARASSFAA